VCSINHCHELCFVTEVCTSILEAISLAPRPAPPFSACHCPYDWQRTVEICDGVHHRFTDSFDCGSVQSTKITEWHLLCVILRNCGRILTVLLRYLQKHCGFLRILSFEYRWLKQITVGHCNNSTIQQIGCYSRADMFITVSFGLYVGLYSRQFISGHSIPRNTFLYDAA